jgi:hypothetical protein
MAEKRHDSGGEGIPSTGDQSIQIRRETLELGLRDACEGSAAQSMKVGSCKRDRAIWADFELRV